MNAARASFPLLLAVALLAAPASSQTKNRPGTAGKPAVAKAKVAPANAKLAQLEDRRSSGHFARCTLGIELPDVPASDAKAARVLVKVAVDDLGTNLVPEDAGEARLGPTQRGQLGSADHQPSLPTIVFAEMKNPPRKAKVLKEVSGEIELFIPSRDPNSEATLPKFLSLAGKVAVNPALKANGVEIAFLSKTQLSAERKKAESAERAKLKKQGITDEESLGGIVEGALYSFPKGEDGEVILRVKDPNKAIQDIEALDGKGKRVFAGVSDEAGLKTLKFWNEKPKPDWKLKVRMQGDKSLIRYTFVFRDVPLP